MSTCSLYDPLDENSEVQKEGQNSTFADKPLQDTLADCAASQVSGVHYLLSSNGPYSLCTALPNCIMSVCRFRFPSMTQVVLGTPGYVS